MLFLTMLSWGREHGDRPLFSPCENVPIQPSIPNFFTQIIAMTTQKFEWTEKLSVGNAMIDSHHKELILAFNDLSDAIEKGNAAMEIKKLLTFLKFYAEWHFGHEESCAAKHQCAIAGQNQQAHAQFLTIFSDLQVQYRESGASEAIARQAHTQLAEWLVGHILKIDTQIAHCLRHSQVTA